MARTKKLAARAECQICARQQALLRPNTIVLHGYTRPGIGYTVGRCPGAYRTTYALDRAALGYWIESLKLMAQDTRKAIARLRVTTALRVHVKRYHAAGKHEDVPYEIVKGQQLPDEVRKGHYTDDAALFERFRTIQIAQQETQLKHIESDIVMQQQRYDAWKYAPQNIIPAGKEVLPEYTATDLRLLTRAAASHGLFVWKYRERERIAMLLRKGLVVAKHKDGASGIARTMYTATDKGRAVLAQEGK